MKTDGERTLDQIASEAVKISASIMEGIVASHPAHLDALLMAIASIYCDVAHAHRAERLALFIFSDAMIKMLEAAKRRQDG